MSCNDNIPSSGDKFLRRRTIAALAFLSTVYAATYAALEAAIALGWHAA